MDIKDILSKMNYDGYSEGIDTIDYFFCSKDAESGAQLFEYLYEDDINDYIKRVYGEGDYKVNSGVIKLEVQRDTKEVNSASITACIETEGELLEIESADLEVEDIEQEIIDGLLKKVDDEI